MSLRAWVVIVASPADRKACSAAARAFCENFERGEVRLTHTDRAMAVHCDLRANRRHADTPASAQYGTCRVLAFDGWIENSHEIAMQLGVPADTPDAVLVARLHAIYAEEAPSKLYGEYSYVVEHADGTFMAVRDKAGVRPLYRASWSDGQAWSNLPGLLAALPYVGKEVDWGYAAEYLNNQESSVSDTLYRRVKRIPGGHRHLLRSSSSTVARYWFPDAHVRRITHDEALAGMQAHLQRAVWGASRGAPYVISHLSGGIDSSTVSIQLDRLVRQGKLMPGKAATASMVYPGLACDERPYIEALSKNLQLPNWQFTPRHSSSEAMRRSTQKLAYPLSPQHATAEAPIMSRAIELGAIVLTGEGGDELLEPIEHAHWQAWLDPRDWPASIRFFRWQWAQRMQTASVLGKSRQFLEPFLSRALRARIERWRQAEARSNTLRQTWMAPDEFERRLSTKPYPRCARTLAMGMTLTGEWSIGWEWYFFLDLHFGVEQRHPLASAALMSYCNRMTLAELDGQESRNRLLLREATLPELPALILKRAGKAEFSESTIHLLRQRLLDLGYGFGQQVQLETGLFALPDESERSIWAFENVLAFLTWYQEIREVG